MRLSNHELVQWMACGSPFMLCVQNAEVEGPHIYFSKIFWSAQFFTVRQNVFETQPNKITIHRFSGNGEYPGDLSCEAVSVKGFEHCQLHKCSVGTICDC